MAGSIPVSPAADTSAAGLQQSSKRWKIWVGRVVSALPIIMMGLSGVMKLMQPLQVVQAFTSNFGYRSNAILPIGILELLCALLYVIPRTATLGAILVTGYFGGAIATHVRISDPSFIGPLILGILAWVGLYLREPRLKALLPFR